MKNRRMHAVAPPRTPCGGSAGSLPLEPSAVSCPVPSRPSSPFCAAPSVFVPRLRRGQVTTAAATAGRAVALGLGDTCRVDRSGEGPERVQSYFRGCTRPSPCSGARCPRRGFGRQRPAPSPPVPDVL